MDFVVAGYNKESQYFRNSIRESERPDRLRIVKSPDDTEFFVYSLRYIPPSPWLAAKGRVVDMDFGYIAETPPNVLDAIRAGRGILLIDSSNEQFSPRNEAMSLLHHRLRGLGLAFDRVIYLTQNTGFEQSYGDWCSKQGIDAGMHIAVHHYFMRQLANYVLQEIIPNGTYAERLDAARRQIESGSLRDKHILKLTFTPRPHRIAALLFMLRHGLLDKAIVSSPGLQNRKLDLRDDIASRVLAEPFPEPEALVKFLPELISRTPIQLDVDRFAKISPVIDVGQSWYYERTCFSLVIDSGLNGADGNRNFTEKPLKAVLGLHPFLLMGFPNSLDFFRSFGFKSFSPMIDESYDSMLSAGDRVAALLSELQRLCALPVSHINEFYKALFAITEHNFALFSGELQDHIAIKYEDPIFRTFYRLQLNTTEFRPADAL